MGLWLGLAVLLNVVLGVSLFGAACVVLYYRRQIQLSQDFDPFTVDLKKMSLAITIKRENGERDLEVTLLKILDCISGENLSMKQIAERLSRVAGLEGDEALTENEARVVLLYVSPALTDFATALKKGVPFG